MRQGCVFHTTTAARRGANPEKLRPRGVGRRVEERGASSRGISVGYQQILLQLVKVKGVPFNCKIVIDILEGQTLHRWEFDGRRPKSSSKNRKKAAAAATSSSNKQQKEEQHKQQPRKSEGQEVWVPKVGGASSHGISVVFEAFFSGYKQNL